MKSRIPFQFENEVVYGQLQEVSPLTRRIVAPNPSLFTYKGTGTYIVGRQSVAVIDPGPDLERHILAIDESLRDEVISHIVVTHTHRDHSSAARPLQRICGAPIYGCTLKKSEHTDEERFEEEFDHEFTPSVEVSDGDLIAGDGWTLGCVHTPGHMSNHFCYRLLEEQSVFTGDHVMGWSTSVIIPPDGSMADYLASLEELLSVHDEVYYPTHGPAIKSPRPYVEALMAHRRERELEVLRSLRDGNRSVDAMVTDVYRDTDRKLHPAAARSLLATLIKLKDEGRVISQGCPTLTSEFALRE